MDDPKTSSVSPVSPPLGIAPETSMHDHLLHEVEATEGQLGAILRYVKKYFLCVYVEFWFIFVTEVFVFVHSS